MTATINASTSAGVVVTSDTSGSLALQTNSGVTALTIDTSQNVGIGTSSPTARLTVASGTNEGAVRVGDNATYYGAFARVQATDEVRIGSYGSSQNLTFYTVSSERMRIDSSGNVGIGTTSPSALLSIKNSSMSSTLLLGANTSNSLYGAISFNGSNADGARIGWTAGGAGNNNLYSDVPSSGNHIWRYSSGSIEAMRIDSSGNLLVGRTTLANTEKFSVQSSADWTVAFSNTHNTSGDLGQYTLMGANCNNTSSYFLNCAISGTGTKFYIYGNGTYGTISDQRLKKNIETARDGYLQDICKLRVVKYNWNTDADETPKELGWIAQELEQVFPNMVQEGIPNEEGVRHKEAKTSVLPFMLLKAIQEQQALIQTLQTQVAQLQAKVGE